MFSRWLIVVGIAVGMAGFHWEATAQLVVFSFNDAARDETSFSPDSQTANGLAGNMTRGSGLIATKAGGTFSAKGWSTEGIDLNNYYSFSFGASSGFQAALSSLELSGRRSGTGIRNWSVRSSLDNFSSDLSPSPFSVCSTTQTLTRGRFPSAARVFPA